jgi:hypothetical protein
MALEEIGRDIERLTGRKLKGPDDCAVASCENRASHVYWRPDEMDCSGHKVMRLCAAHAEGARRINGGTGTVTPIRGRS